jgi:hypothetical protein
MANLTFEGGLNEQDASLVDPSECIEGYNFELGGRNTHYQPRKPFDLLGTATNASQINGFIQLIKADDTETTLVQAGDTVYSWDGGATFTSKGTVSTSSRLRGATWTLGGYSVIVDTAKATVVKKWDGTSFTTLTTGLSPATLYAKYAIVHLGRMWLFNVKTGVDTPHLMVASEFEDPESYDTAKRAQDSTFSTGNEAFYMVTPDLKPINGVALFFGSLVVSTMGGQLWKLTGTDSMDFAWVPFYAGSAAIATETMANIGDDVVYMKRDGVIESISATEKFGDTKTDDLSRWVSGTTDGLTSCITVYDQTRQKVYFFAGSNNLLVLFKEMLATNLSPWSVYRTANAASFSTNAAIYMRQPGASNYYVYWGDDSGNIYQMDGTGDGDAGSDAISAHRRTRMFDRVERKDGSVFDPNTDVLRGRVYYRRVSDVDLLMDVEWADDYATNRCTIPLDGPASGDSASYFGGSAYFGTDIYLSLPGASGNYASTPDSAAVSITGDIDIRAKVALDDWTPSAHQTIASKYQFTSSSPLRSWLFRVGTTGLLRWTWSTDGVNTTTADSTVGLPSLGNGDAKWLRVTHQSDGATGTIVRFYTSDDGETWTQLGSDKNPTATHSIAGSTTNVLLGAHGSTGQSDVTAGKIYYAEVRNGIDGTVVAKFDPPNDAADGVTSFTSSTGEVWTINQSGSPAAEIVDPASSNFNTGFQFSQRTSTKGFSAVGRGPGFYLGLTVQSALTFDIMRIEI